MFTKIVLSVIVVLLLVANVLQDQTIGQQSALIRTMMKDAACSGVYPTPNTKATKPAKVLTPRREQRAI